MNKEKDILKWFNSELTSEQMKERYPEEDFSLLEKSMFYTKNIERPNVNPESALKDFRAKYAIKKEPKVIPLNFSAFLKIAAVLVVMLSASYFVFFNGGKTISTDIAETEIFSLPDDSEVILNSKSNLAYDKNKWKKERKLTLNGEAYFKVTKGNKFTVKTTAGNVQVLGTQFNVKNRDGFFQVHCYEGSVEVRHLNKSYVLVPGNAYRWVKNGKGQLMSFKGNTPSWIKQESSFDNVPLWQVIEEIEAKYDIEIVTTKIDVNVLFTGSFTHKNRELALQSVTIPLKLSFNIAGNKVELYNYEAN